MTNQTRDFQLFARDYRVSSLDLHNVNQRLISNSQTPYILEERSMNMIQMDVFSRLMSDRIIFLAGAVDDRMATVTQAQLQFLASVDNKDITLQINSPGGSVYSGLGIIDVMNYIDPDIRTINMSMAASMGSLLLGAGTKGKRASLPSSKTMIHQSSSGYQGEYGAAEVYMKEWTKINEKIYELLSEYTGQTVKKLKKDSERDLWLDANEAITYGIIDELVVKKIKK